MVGQLTQAFGGAARRRTERDTVIHSFIQCENRIDRCCFAGAGAAGEDKAVLGHGLADGFLLERRVSKALRQFQYLDVLVEAVGRLLRIAEQVDVPVVIVHTTNIEALDEIANARWRGQKVFVETCPQYLVLDDSVYYNEDWLQAAKYVCSPPIRKPADREALWRAIRRGEVQTVSTDHCSFTTQQKLAGRDDFTAIPGGIPGVETRGELIYTFGVAKKKIGLGAMCRVLAENPAKLYGLFPRKGVLAPGSDADIVVYDPNADHVIRAEDMVGAADYNPYEGVVTKGSIRQVWLRGKPAVSSGKVLAGPDGKYLPRGKCQL